PAAPLPPSATPASASSDDFEKTIKLSSVPAPAPLATPKVQGPGSAPSMPVIPPKPVVSAPIPKAITEAIPLNSIPPRPTPKPAAPSAPAAPKINTPTPDTKAVSLASLPTPGMSAQGPASIPPKVAVPGTAPKPMAPGAPKATVPVAPVVPPSSAAKPAPAAIKPATPSAVSGPASASIPPKSVSSTPASKPSEKSTPAPAAVEVDDDEPSMAVNILAITAAVLALGVAGYLFYAMSNNVVS
ncbi:MAG: hypothetical protein V4507_15330, partial [Verrucomicrobiota bacterium]